MKYALYNLEHCACLQASFESSGMLRGSYSLTFRDNLLVLSSRVKLGALEMRPMDCPETSVNTILLLVTFQKNEGLVQDYQLLGEGYCFFLQLMKLQNINIG